MTKNQTIIIKKIKKSGHGHHGGAWKVAYADFVTAMMAFFLMLWLVSTVPEETREGIAEYFHPMHGLIGHSGSSVIDIPNSGDKQENSESNKNLDSELIQIEASIQNVLRDEEVSKYGSMISTKRINDGMLVELIDNPKLQQYVFSIDKLTKYTEMIVTKLTHSIENIPVYVTFIGMGDGQSHEWDLSINRSLNVMRYMKKLGLDNSRIASVTGRGNFEVYNNTKIGILFVSKSALPKSKLNLPMNVH